MFNAGGGVFVKGVGGKLKKGSAFASTARA